MTAFRGISPECERATLLNTFLQNLKTKETFIYFAFHILLLRFKNHARNEGLQPTSRITFNSPSVDLKTKQLMTTLR